MQGTLKLNGKKEQKKFDANNHKYHIFTSALFDISDSSQILKEVQNYTLQICLIHFGQNVQQGP